MGQALSSIAESPAVYWGDVFALALQELRAQGKIHEDQPLVRIDYREEAAQAPFQFDPVSGTLHRRQCRVIPFHSRSALFARWNISPLEQDLACVSCRPYPLPQGREAQDITLDIFFGVISILDQFGTILRERGKEYRSSQEGQELERKLQDLYGNLDRKQQDTLNVLLQTMDQMVKFLQEADHHLHEHAFHISSKEKAHTNGNFSGNGHYSESPVFKNGYKKPSGVGGVKRKRGRSRKT